jgi:hypothetical protein
MCVEQDEGREIGVLLYVKRVQTTSKSFLNEISENRCLKRTPMVWSTKVAVSRILPFNKHAPASQLFGSIFVFVVLSNVLRCLFGTMLFRPVIS